MYANFVLGRAALPSLVEDTLKLLVPEAERGAPISVPILAYTEEAETLIKFRMNAERRMAARARLLECGASGTSDTDEADEDDDGDGPSITAQLAAAGARTTGRGRAASISSRAKPTKSPKRSSAIAYTPVTTAETRTARKALVRISPELPDGYEWYLIGAALWELAPTSYMVYSTEPLFRVVCDKPLFAVEVDISRVRARLDAITLESDGISEFVQLTGDAALQAIGGAVVVQATSAAAVVVRNPFSTSAARDGTELTRDGDERDYDGDEDDDDDGDDEDDDDDDAPRIRRRRRTATARIAEAGSMGVNRTDTLVSLFQPFATVYRGKQRMGFVYGKPGYSVMARINTERAWEQVYAVIDCHGLWAPPVGHAWAAHTDMPNSRWKKLKLLVRNVPRAAMPDGAKETLDGNGLVSVWDDRVFYTTGHYDMPSAVAPMLPPVDESAFLQAWADSLVESLLERRRKAQSEIDELNRRLLDHASQIGRFDAVINASMTCNMDPLREMLQQVQAHPDVLNLTLHSDHFAFTTTPFWLQFMPSGRDTFRDERWWVGAYDVQVFVTESRINVRSHHYGDADYIHPHNSGRHGFCLSGYATAFSSAYAAVDYYTVVLTLLEYLRTSNEKDGTSMAHLRHSIKHAPFAGKRSDWIQLV